MTAHIHHILFGLPFSEPNKERMQRFGVAVFAENVSGQPNLTNARRLAIADGTVPIANVLAYDNAFQTQSQSFQAIYSTTDGSTADYYIGTAQMTATQWNRIKELIDNAALTGLRWARLTTDEGDRFFLRAHNVTLLNPYNDQEVTEEFLLGVLGLVRYVPARGIDPLKRKVLLVERSFFRESATEVTTKEELEEGLFLAQKWSSGIRRLVPRSYAIQALSQQ
jgi:hypothetical protein